MSPQFWKENVEKLDFFKLFDTKWGKVVQIVTFQGEFLAEKIPKKFQNFKISRKYQFPWELKNRQILSEEISKFLGKIKFPRELHCLFEEVFGKIYEKIGFFKLFDTKWGKMSKNLHEKGSIFCKKF